MGTYAATLYISVFTNYFQNSFLKKIGSGPVICDGHAGHVGAEVINMAIEHNNILELPSHTSHILQPLDLCVFKSLRTHWDAQLVDWQKNVGLAVTKSFFQDDRGYIDRNQAGNINKRFC